MKQLQTIVDLVLIEAGKTMGLFPMVNIPKKSDCLQKDKHIFK